MATKQWNLLWSSSFCTVNKMSLVFVFSLEDQSYDERRIVTCSFNLSRRISLRGQLTFVQWVKGTILYTRTVAPDRLLLSEAMRCTLIKNNKTYGCCWFVIFGDEDVFDLVFVDNSTLGNFGKHTSFIVTWKWNVSNLLMVICCF